MTVDLKKMTEERVEDATEAAVMGADLVSGAVATGVDAMAHPVETARTLERRGSRVNREVVEDVEEAVAPLMPERLLLAGIHAIKGRARRRDLVGSIAYRALELLNGRFEDLGGVARRFERATEPPARNGDVHRPARTVARKTARTAKRAAGAAARSARRGTSRARRSERRSS